MAGFLKLSTDSKVDDMMEANPFAFLLVTQIARRARRTNGGLNKHKLEIGEALIGDFASIGLTEQTYRTAKAQLAEWGIATFRPTTKGTIAKLVDTSVYDINAEQGNGRGNGQITGRQRTANGRVTTNEERKEGEEGKEGEGAPAPEDPMTGFDEFWQAYPKKKAKPDAVKAWQIHACSAKRSVILAAVRAAAMTEDWIERGGKFIPYPASWLNSAGWEDELTPSIALLRPSFIPPPQGPPAEEDDEPEQETGW